MEAMLASGIDYTIFFYNPNIHPQKVYERPNDRRREHAGQDRCMALARRMFQK